MRFVKTIHKAGLYAHLRIGPYVCAEWNFGYYLISFLVSSASDASRFGYLCVYVICIQFLFLVNKVFLFLFWQ